MTLLTHLPARVTVPYEYDSYFSHLPARVTVPYEYDSFLKSLSHLPARVTVPYERLRPRPAHPPSLIPARPLGTVTCPRLVSAACRLPHADCLPAEVAPSKKKKKKMTPKSVGSFVKKNLNAPRPSKHPPVFVA